MATPRTDKIYRYLKANGDDVWFRYDIDDAGAYQFVFQTGTSVADQNEVVALPYFQNVLNYPGATTTTGDVVDGLTFTTGLFGDGSAASPSISFTANPNTGFYRPANNTIGVSCGGVLSYSYSPTAFVAANTVTSGFQLYNTADQVTNFERLEAVWATNQCFLRTIAGGTGSTRMLILSSQTATGSYIRLELGRAASPFASITTGATSSTGTWFNVLPNSTAASGTVIGLSITPTYNQAASTAANTDLLINRTETLVGSGQQNLIDAQVGGSSRFRVDNGGNVIITAAQSYTFSGRSTIASPSDGNLLLRNAAGSDFGRIQFGGTTSSFPSLKRAGTVLEARLADDSGYSTLAGSIIVSVSGQIMMNGSNTVFILRGTGSPESVVTASVGSLFMRTDGGAGTTLYVKESGAGNTGWVPVVP